MVKTGRPEAVKPHRTEMAGSLKSLKSMLGGMVGVVVAHACLRGIVLLVPPNLIPGEPVFGLNWPALLFSAFVSGATVLIFGLVPRSRRPVTT